jgi:predicted O-linked N-acetylglucosamine transferase (SPINDLY family)
MPEDAVVFVSEAAHEFITPEVRETWARLLAQVPGSQLILHPFRTGMEGNRAANFGALVEAALQRHEVDVGRFLLSTLELSNPGDVQALLSVGDIYLEAFPTNSVEGMLRAFEAGLPVVACEGKTLRSSAGSAWLESLGLKSLVAQDAAAYVATARRLAMNPTARLDAAATVKKQMTHLPLLSDGLAVSDDFGSLLETAFDQLSLMGEKTFKAERSTLRPATVAFTDRPGRWKRGRQLAEEGRTARAVDYFMAAIGSDDGTAALWLDTARALRANAQSAEAIQALETALRLDPKLVEGWKLLAELAELAMIPDLAAEARQIIDTLVPAPNAKTNVAGSAQPKVESIVGKLRSMRIARQGIV